MGTYTDWTRGEPWGTLYIIDAHLDLESLLSMTYTIWGLSKKVLPSFPDCLTVTNITENPKISFPPKYKILKQQSKVNKKKTIY